LRGAPHESGLAWERSRPTAALAEPQNHGTESVVMKTLLVSGTYFPPQVGGISRVMERLAAALGRERVCCLTGVAGAARMLDEGGVKVYRSSTIFSDRGKAARGLAWGASLASILWQERPKAVLLGTVDDGLYGRWLERWLGLPYVVYAHGNEICRILSAPDGPSVNREVLRAAARVIAVSRFTAELVERAGVPRHRIDIVYSGCDLHLFTPRPPDPELRARLLGDRSGGQVILTTGNLVARKGHDMVLRALPGVQAAGPMVTYLIVGDGPERLNLERLAAALGVRDRVVFAGRVSDADLPAIYALADVFVMASRERPEENDVEGFGLVYLEAGACGRAVIGGRSGGVPEAVIDGVTGLLVDPSDPADIASALTRVLTEPGLADSLGAQGAVRTVREFAWSRCADQVDGVLTAVAAGRGTPA
jgi:phosphatidyl-myo-inositol dimannoside synthase